MSIHIDEPTDFLGNIFAKVITSYLQKARSPPKIETWKMRAVLITDFYAISLIFENGLEISRGETESPTLQLTTTMATIIQVAKGDVSLRGAILRRRVIVKGLFRHPMAAFRLYRLINNAIGG
jgi:hypothetical protein